MKEGGRVEFKETTGQLERGMETLCAFLNGEGGSVLFGVNDKGKIIGQEVSDKTKRGIVLYKRRVLESWGRGIGLMMSECRNAGLPEPEFRMWSDSVTLLFKCEVANRPTTDQLPTNYRSSTDQLPTKHRPSNRPTTDQVFVLVKVLKNSELSVKEIMEALELNHRPTFRANYLNPALKKGYVVPLYPEQPNHPRQKYRLTEKGVELLKQQ